MTVYIVTNGLGGQIDSAWDSPGAANARANSLNEPGGMTLAWMVVQLKVQQSE